MSLVMRILVLTLNPSCLNMRMFEYEEGKNHPQSILFEFALGHKKSVFDPPHYRIRHQLLRNLLTKILKLYCISTPLKYMLKKGF